MPTIPSALKSRQPLDAPSTKRPATARAQDTQSAEAAGERRRGYVGFPEPPAGFATHRLTPPAPVVVNTPPAPSAKVWSGVRGRAQGAVPTLMLAVGGVGGAGGV